MTGLKAYLPAFWTLPSLFLTEAAAAGEHRPDQLGGKPRRVHGALRCIGKVESITGSFLGGILFLCLDVHIGDYHLVPGLSRS